MSNPDKLKCPNCSGTDIEWEYSEDYDGKMSGSCYGTSDNPDCEAWFAAYPVDYNIYRIDNDKDELITDD